MLLEPLRPFLVTADGEGVLRIANYRAGGLVNRFHAASGGAVPSGSGSRGAAAAAATAAQPVAVRALYQVCHSLGNVYAGGRGACTLPTASCMPGCQQAQSIHSACPAPARACPLAPHS